ncbi:TPM domain-containing protein [Candidatus Woesearchaeota archaeon]|nr:TPM domain-containing protein [Candidatus Woesearchaeota archaeon]
MKKQHTQLVCILFLLLLANSLQALVEIKTYVNDYAGIFSEDEEQQLYTKLDAINQQGSAQIAIVTINSLEGRDIESYSLEVAQGHLGDTEKNNGLLLLIAVEDRKYRFEVGRGLEPILNDARVGRIGRDNLIEAFRAGEYGKGVLNAMDQVEVYLESGPEPEPTPEYLAAERIGKFIVFGFLFIIVGIFITIKMVWRNHAPRKWKDNDYFNAALGAVLLGGRRGGSGGFGGFGGGGFGGGGGGGSW